jgi:hypothetical protein
VWQAFATLGPFACAVPLKVAVSAASLLHDVAIARIANTSTEDDGPFVAPQGRLCAPIAMFSNPAQPDK